MHSVVAVTYEMDNPAKAVDDLLKQLELRGPLNKNSCGFLFCDADMNYEPVGAMLQARLPFDVVGCTSIANFDREQGVQTFSASLLVLTADDVRFSTVLTGALTDENVNSELQLAYDKAKASADGPGKLLFLFPPFDETITLDTYVDTLNRLSGAIPVFGGLPSSSTADDDILVFAEGKVFSDRAVIVLLEGNVQPLFSVQNVLSSFSDQKSLVTKAKKNVIYRVEDRTFVDYLKSVGLDTDELIAQGDLAVYVSTPLKVNMNKDEDHDGIPVVRTIKSLNPLDGSGILFGEIPELSTLSIVTMKRQDIQDSSLKAVRDIQEQIAASSGDYVYTVLLCVSCGGRYLVMADDKEVEGKIIADNISRSLTLSGFYAYGEVCPTHVRNGKALNRVHNESIVMCAL